MSNLFIHFFLDGSKGCTVSSLQFIFHLFLLASVLKHVIFCFVI